MPEIVNNKRYHTLDNYYKERFGTKIAKVSLNGGFTCPNRDGTKGFGGCIYCSPMASGDFAGNKEQSIREQFLAISDSLKGKWGNVKYIPYFQAGTGTYAPLCVLKEKYEEALSLDNVVGLSIATRPDCIKNDVLSYLAEINQRTFLTVELGLQTIHDSTGDLIHRQTTYREFEECYFKLTKKGIAVCVHLINGLPCETHEMMMESVKKVSSLRPHSIKLHMLHILKDTIAAQLYANGKIKCFNKDEYVALICDELEAIPYETVIARITGDGAADSLIAPLWSIKKFDVINGVDQEMKRRNAFQGNRFGGSV